MLSTAHICGPSAYNAVHNMKKKVLFLAIFMLIFCLLLFYYQKDITLQNQHLLLSWKWFLGNPMLTTDNSKKAVRYNNTFSKYATENRISIKENITLFTIICNAKQNKKYVNNGQMKHFTVLLKSASLLSRTQLRFHIISDTDAIKNSISSLTTSWPSEHRSRLVFEYHKLSYPAGSEKLRNLYLPCATQRLFLPDMFPSLDAAIYLDTDIIFLRSPEELWKEFYEFNDIQLAAIGPTSFYRLAKIKVPYYPPGGLNPGIMMMNLTRMRSYPLGIPVGGSWSTAMLGIVKTFQGRLNFADMDILNIFFNQNPRLLYPLGCWWNFLTTHCKTQSPCLPHMAREHHGVAVLHGAGDAFISHDETKLKVVFKSFLDINVRFPLTDVLTSLKKNLQTSKNSTKSICNKVPNLNELLTMELEKYI